MVSEGVVSEWNIFLFIITVYNTLECMSFALSSLVQVNEAVIALVKGAATLETLIASNFTLTGCTINLGLKTYSFTHTI